MDLSSRVWYKRRLHMQHKPLIIIYFEGVIGFLQQSGLYLRRGVSKFIHRQRHDFQIVLVTNYSYNETQCLKEILDKKEICFDAIYTLKFNTKD